MNLNTGGWASRALTPLLRIIRGATNATVPVVVISEPVNSETAALVNADIALVAKGTGATLAQVPDGTVAGGDKRGQYATDLQKARNGSIHVASGTASVVTGGERNRASSSWATVSGGFLNVASGQYSTVAGGGDNNATSNYNFVGGGQSNLAQTNTHATVCGGNSNTASGQYAFVGGGQSNSATGLRSTISGGISNFASASHSVVCGGQDNNANATCSFISGGNAGTTRSIVGNHVFPALNNPFASMLYGKAQSALLLVARETTDATATVLTSNSSAASTTNQVILPNNAAYSFSGDVIAGRTGAGDTARWTINGAIKRGASAATTAMVGTPTVTMTHNDAGASGWIVAVTADTTNGGIKVEVTGAASTTIRWVCKITTTEMTY